MDNPVHLPGQKKSIEQMSRNQVLLNEVCMSTRVRFGPERNIFSRYFLQTPRCLIYSDSSRTGFRNDKNIDLLSTSGE